MNTTTFRAVPGSEDIKEQTVSVDGQYIGTVWRIWYRLGGERWTNSLCRSTGFQTRHEAANDLRRRYKAKEQS